jgi:hypothetical protein
MGRFFLCVHFFCVCAISRNSLIDNDLWKLVRAISRKCLTVNDLQKSGRPKSLIHNDLRKKKS